MRFPVPFLTFTHRDGLDLPAFNTIRLGRAWFKRLKKGDRILLAHKHEILCSARVVMLACGPVHKMLAEHAVFNHRELALAAQQRTDYAPDQAPARRLESMRRNYGPAKVTDTSHITVIGLKLIKVRSSG
jgi:hypothetical protein